MLLLLQRFFLERHWIRHRVIKRCNISQAEHARCRLCTRRAGNVAVDHVILRTARRGGGRGNWTVSGIAGALIVVEVVVVVRYDDSCGSCVDAGA